VSHNFVPIGVLPELIKQVFAALDTASTEPAVAEPPQPAVSIRASLAPDTLTCMDCGYTFKMLKRHLMSDHGMTPEQYRVKWGLASDYPMVAPDYAETRSHLAKRSGLGLRRPMIITPGRKRA
jgi:predicted transcriptional regulator